MTDAMMKPAPEAPGAIHSTFRVSRTYPQAPERVFKAFEDTDLVRRWRVEDENCKVLEFTYDFRVGGTEVSRFVFPGGPEIRLDAQFQDIVPNERIIFSYRMLAGSMLLSVSLSTIEIKRSGRGTDLIFTEQGVYFEGPDSAKNREEGTRFILEKLAKELAG
ncbi:SRPBCC family protein [Pleomorphomonas oryzae]|uniref:SRPBCC family protein n=1 Tax=Pleomorphomonas oryzae TaxID=261934 RepID=UPI00041FCC47|nr:SRPBCC family protein [Pleomorphomonas oryzae]